MIVLLKYNFLRVKFIYLIRGLFSPQYAHSQKSTHICEWGWGVIDPLA